MTRHAGTAPGRPRRSGDAPSWRQRRWRTSVLVLATMEMAADALAQDVRPPAVEIAGGYQFFAGPDARSSSGWLVSAAHPLGGGYAVVGEVANLSQRESNPYVESEQQWWTLLGGVRHAWRRRVMTPFVEVLGGAALSRFRDVRYIPSANTGELVPFADAIKRSFGVFQVGAGVNIRIANRVGVQLAAHSQTTYIHEGHLVGFSTLRFTTAAAVGIGNR